MTRSIFKLFAITMVLSLMLSVLPAAQHAQAATPTDLFISEYIEGSSFNKAIEIYNGTGAPVDLGAGLYTLELYSNGSPTVSQSMALTGTIANGDVFVLAHPSADPLILAEEDVTNGSVINFNGDDAVVLRKNGAVIDAFGQIGTDPGSQWGSDLTSTADNTLRRKVMFVPATRTAAMLSTHRWSGMVTPTIPSMVLAATPPTVVVAPLDLLNPRSTSSRPARPAQTWNTLKSSARPIPITAPTPRSKLRATSAAPPPAPWMKSSTSAPPMPTAFTWSTCRPMPLKMAAYLCCWSRISPAAFGDDLDTNEDGTLDVTPWDAVVDAVSVNDGGASDLTYGVPALGPNYDGVSSFAPGGASRIPDGFDTECGQRLGAQRLRPGRHPRLRRFN